MEPAFFVIFHLIMENKFCSSEISSYLCIVIHEEWQTYK